MTPDVVTSIDDIVAGPHGPVPVRWYEPQPGALPLGAAPIVWLHGGAFLRGDLDLPETHEVARALAARGFRVVTVEYRLVSLGFRRTGGAPPIRYPVPVDDVVAVVRAVQRDHPDGVILGGASAGACLAAGAVVRLAADGAPPLRGLFFAYGLFHARLPELSREVRSRLRGRRRFMHAPVLLNLLNRFYAGTSAALAEPFAFAGGHPLDGFPPALLIDAESDSMRASGGQFARELADAAVPVEYHVLAGTAHAFLNRPRDPGFARAIGLIADWAGRT